MKLNRQTKLLIIRPLEARDYGAWRTAHSEMLPQRNRWDVGPRPNSELTRARFQKNLKNQKKLRREDRFYDLAVFERKSGQLVGGVSIMDVNRGLSQSAYLGYRIFNRQWGLGFGKDSVNAIIDVAFRDLGLHRLEAGIEIGNRRSYALARSLGLRREGIKRRAVYLRKEWRDLVMFSITCEERGAPWRGQTQARPR